MKKKVGVCLLVTVLISSMILPVEGETYTYDNDGRVTSVTYEDGSEEHYTYDESGNIKEVNVIKKEDSEEMNPKDQQTTQVNPSDPIAPPENGKSVIPSANTAYNNTGILSKPLTQLQNMLNGSFFSYIADTDARNSLLKTINGKYSLVSTKWQSIMNKAKTGKKGFEVKKKKGNKKTKKKSNSKNKKNNKANNKTK